MKKDITNLILKVRVQNVKFLSIRRSRLEERMRKPKIRLTFGTNAFVNSIKSKKESDFFRFRDSHEQN